MSKQPLKTNEPSKTRADYRDEIKQLRNRMPTQVTAPQLFVTDTTPEGCRQLLAENGERCAILTDEPATFDIMGGLYTGGIANLDVFLQGHAGGQIKVKRGKTLVALNKIAISIGLAIQPEPLSALGSGDKKSFRGKGLLARFLYYLPRSNVGSRDVRKRKSMPNPIQDAYRVGIKQLLAIKPQLDEQGIEQPRMLTLAPDALDAWGRFSQDIENNQADGGKYDRLQDFTGKLPGAALRIAGLCHVAEYGESGSVISKETVEPVLDLCEKLIIHAQAAFDMMGDDPVIADAKAVFKWIVGNTETDDGTYFIKQSELHNSGRFKNSKLERLTKALEVLRERHILGPQRRVKTDGRPSIRWYVNPAVVLKGATNGMA